MLQDAVARSSSSTSIPRVGDDGARATRLLRLRADARLHEMILPPHGRLEAGRLRVPSRETVAVGDRVRVEIGFGALVDEVELATRVVAIDPSSSGAPPVVVLAVELDSAGPLGYVAGVLSGQHSARARAHRRIAVDVAVKWRCGELRQDTRARDLSRGGAFVLSRLAPPVGTAVVLEFETTGGAAAVRIDAVVSWVQRQGTQCGFGARFSVRTRDDAERITSFIRALEHDADGR